MPPSKGNCDDLFWFNFLSSFVLYFIFTFMFCFVFVMFYLNITTFGYSFVLFHLVTDFHYLFFFTVILFYIIHSAFSFSFSIHRLFLHVRFSRMISMSSILAFNCLYNLLFYIRSKLNKDSEFFTYSQPRPKALHHHSFIYPMVTVR